MIGYLLKQSLLSFSLILGINLIFFLLALLSWHLIEGQHKSSTSEEKPCYFTIKKQRKNTFIQIGRYYLITLGILLMIIACGIWASGTIVLPAYSLGQYITSLAGSPWIHGMMVLITGFIFFWLIYYKLQQIHCLLFPLSSIYSKPELNLDELINSKHSSAELLTHLNYLAANLKTKAIFNTTYQIGDQSSQLHSILNYAYQNSHFDIICWYLLQPHTLILALSGKNFLHLSSEITPQDDFKNTFKELKEKYEELIIHYFLDPMINHPIISPVWKKQKNNDLLAKDYQSAHKDILNYFKNEKNCTVFCHYIQLCWQKNVYPNVESTLPDLLLFFNHLACFMIELQAQLNKKNPYHKRGLSTYSMQSNVSFLHITDVQTTPPESSSSTTSPKYLSETNSACASSQRNSPSYHSSKDDSPLPLLESSALIL